MTYVLVDSSVWIAHFRQPEPALDELLDLDNVLGHPMILGEVACGTPSRRLQTLKHLSKLQQTEQATLNEVLGFVEREKLYGRGCGIVDLTLLACTLMTADVALWTLDKPLAALANRFKVAYRPLRH